MGEFFASGRAVDLILGLMVLEISGLAIYRQKTGRGVSVSRLAGNMLAGAFLLLAVRAALTGAAWPWIAGFLLAGLLGHFIDLAQRWRE
jgi:F0F1-type ATP synthase membrane subunit a